MIIYFFKLPSKKVYLIKSEYSFVLTTATSNTKYSYNQKLIKDIVILILKKFHLMGVTISTRV